MVYFKWKGMRQDGTLCQGVDKADDVQQIQEILFARGVALLDCKHSFSLGRWIPCRGFDDAVLALLFEQLGMLIGAGIPLLQALGIVRQGIGQGILSDTLEMMSNDIQKGSPLARAMAQHPLVFKKYVIALVGTGEQTGRLNEVFVFLAAYFRSWGELEKKLKQSAMIPLFTLAFAAIVIMAILAFVVPKFAIFLTSVSAKLPLSTRCVLWLSEASTLGNIVLGGLFFMVGVFGWRLSARTQLFRNIKEKVILRIPIIKDAYICSNLVHFLAMNILFLKSGFSLKDALQNIQTITSSLTFERCLGEVVCGLDQGKTLHEAMGGTYAIFFPERLRMMVAMGEQGGDLVGVLERTLVMYQQDLERKFALIEAIFYPLLMIFVGAIIALLMVSVYLPIFSAANAFNF